MLFSPSGPEFWPIDFSMGRRNRNPLSRAYLALGITNDFIVGSGLTGLRRLELRFSNPDVLTQSGPTAIISSDAFNSGLLKRNL